MAPLHIDLGIRLAPSRRVQQIYPKTTCHTILAGKLLGGRLLGRRRRHLAHHRLRVLLGLAAVERRAPAPQRLERAPEPYQVLLLEAAADVARVHEPIAVVVADDERAEALGPAPLARHPAANHHLLALHVLDLQPAARAPAGLVGAVQALGDHALEPALPARREHALAVALVVGGGAPGRAVELQLVEQLAPVLVREPQRGAPVDVEQVEDHVGGGDVLHPPAHRALGGEVHAALQLLEAGPAAVVEGDDLAVQDQLPRAHRLAELAQLGVLPRHLAAVAVEEPDAAALDERERPDAVPLDLIAPVLVVLRELRELGEHRYELVRHRLPLAALRRVPALVDPVLAPPLVEQAPALPPLAL